MCDEHPIAPTRRQVLLAAPAGLALGIVGAPRLRSTAVAAALSIVPRSQWGPGLAPTGPVPDEPDVRFLLVHHSVNANTYGADAVPGLLTGIYRFHTGERGWPDIAYNFFVDRFGGVWEGRTGSLERAKAADATGGSQGFAQLCCFLGDHSTSPPTPAAQASMGALLGWLAGRHGVDLADGARARFTSRGSNRYPAGSAVDVPTVAGHRDVSQTACPGDAAYALVTDGTFRRLALGAGGPVPTTSPTTTPPPPTSTAAPPPTFSSTSTTYFPAHTVPGGEGSAPPWIAAPAPDEDGGASGLMKGAVGAGVLAGAAGLLLALRARGSGPRQ